MRPKRRTLLATCLISALAVLATAAAARQDAPKHAKAKDPQIGQTFRVPYLRTLTNHYLVRVRINGKGPFNFLVDTGAPALYIGTEAAKKAGLKPPPENARTIWTDVERFEIEGGIELNDVKGHVFDVFQLKGMNALGLPGARIDGILGFTILARFRMQFDPTSDRLDWTRLDYNPPDPYVPEDPKQREMPAELRMLEALGPAMQFMSLLVGKQPEDLKQPQGLLGLELEEADGRLRVAKVLPGTPAESAGLKPGDVLVKVADQDVEKRDAAHAAVAQVKPGDRVVLVVRRDNEEVTLDLTAVEGL